MSTLDEQAIQAALSGRWQDAVVLNQEIVKKDKENIDALNRLAYANAKCGNYEKACEIYNKVLRRDSYNPLATKNLAKFKKYHNSKKNNGAHETALISPSLFLTDNEKTKTVNLLNLASHDVLQELAAGEEVFPVPKRFELHIKNITNKYLGTLPDDIGHPLLKVLKNNHSGCRFFVKDFANNRVTVFIKY